MTDSNWLGTATGPHLGDYDFPGNWDAGGVPSGNNGIFGPNARTKQSR